MKRLLYLIIPILFLVISPSVQALDPIQKDTSVSVFIGDNRFTLFGYTSPYAHVRIEGQGIFDTVQADMNGYFIFKNRFSPTSPTEPCVYAVDTDGRITNPYCLAPFPATKNVTIGPIILPPSISLSSEYYDRGDTAYMFGQAAPNTNVRVVVQEDDGSTITLTSHSKDDGRYSADYQTLDTGRLRTYSYTSIDTFTSGKSNSLTVSIFGFIRSLLAEINNFFKSLAGMQTYVLILFEICVILLLMYLTSRKKVYALAIRPKNSLKLISNALKIREKYPISSKEDLEGLGKSSIGTK